MFVTSSLMLFLWHIPSLLSCPFHTGKVAQCRLVEMHNSILCIGLTKRWGYDVWVNIIPPSYQADQNARWQLTTSAVQMVMAAYGNCSMIFNFCGIIYFYYAAPPKMRNVTLPAVYAHDCLMDQDITGPYCVIFRVRVSRVRVSDHWLSAQCSSNSDTHQLLCLSCPICTRFDTDRCRLRLNYRCLHCLWSCLKSGPGQTLSYIVKQFFWIETDT